MGGGRDGGVVYPAVGLEVQEGALRLERSGSTDVDVSLVERLQQPHKVSALALEETPHETK